MTTLTDEREASLAVGATGLLQVFNQAGVLGLADVHTAQAVTRMCGETDESVQLAVGLAVRALRNGSVCISLDTIHTVVFNESEEQIDVSCLPWPEPPTWVEACAHSPVVNDGADAVPNSRPVRLVDGRLYLERYWLQQELVRSQLQARAAAPAPDIDMVRLAAALGRLFPGTGLAAGESDNQRLAAAVSANSWVTIVAGGPGTGKTTAVAALLALLRDQPGRPVRIALAAPTGKAAARLEQAVRAATAKLDNADADRLGTLTASTLHRLLGWLPGSRGRFRHNDHNHLPFDVIVVDEMSMVSLTMMARLLEAVRPDARLVLVGDPDQLSSVEAGAVLADISHPTGLADPELSARLRELGLVGDNAAVPAVVGRRVVTLTHTWRFGGSIEQLAQAIRASDPDATMAVLRKQSDDVQFVEVDLAASSLESSGPRAASAVREALRPLELQVRWAGQLVHKAAEDGLVKPATDALDLHRLLCAHRQGPFGVARWSREAEHWLTEAIPGYAQDGEWYAGRPLLVTANDYEMGLYNGDTGVVINTGHGMRAVFARGDEAYPVAPVRLEAVQTMHAMTVHRAQGSQFECVSFIVPPPESPLLTRELLYTAVTRATKRVQVFGTEVAIRRAVVHPASRASGLRERLG